MVGPITLGGDDGRHIRPIGLAEWEVGPAVTGGETDVDAGDRLTVGVDVGVDGTRGAVPVEVGAGDGSLDIGDGDQAATDTTHAPDSGDGEVGVEVGVRDCNVIGASPVSQPVAETEQRYRPAEDCEMLHMIFRLDSRLPSDLSGPARIAPGWDSPISEDQSSMT